MTPLVRRCLYVLAFALGLALGGCDGGDPVAPEQPTLCETVLLPDGRLVDVCR